MPIVIVTIVSMAGIAFKVQQEPEWPLRVRLHTDVTRMRPVG